MGGLPSGVNDMDDLYWLYMYLGHNEWIMKPVCGEAQKWKEIDRLAQHSWRQLRRQTKSGESNTKTSDRFWWSLAKSSCNWLLVENDFHSFFSSFALLDSCPVVGRLPSLLCDSVNPSNTARAHSEDRLNTAWSIETISFLPAHPTHIIAHTRFRFKIPIS